jgi:Cu/Ag efflux pump CusA
MIARLVAASLKAPVVVFALALSVLLAGAFAFRHVDFASTSPLPTIVEVIAEPAGMSAEDVERSVAAPLELGLAGMPGLEHTRAQSLFGLTTLACTFRRGIGYADARHGLTTGNVAAAAEAAQLRLRPMLITTLVAIAGLLPVTISRGLGAESQQPFAFVVIGGALFVTVIARLFHAPLLVLLHHFHLLDHLSGRALRGDSLNGT